MKDVSKGSPKGSYHARGMQAKERGYLPVPEVVSEKKKEEAKKEKERFFETMRGAENLYRPSTNF